MQIRPISIFAKRISYQSTCVKVRTTFSNCGGVLSKETRNCDYYSEEFSIKRTSKSTNNSYCELSESSSIFLRESDHHRMPVVAAVVAHRRFYPAASSLAGSAVGSHRSSCAGRLNALSILTPPLAPTGVRKASTSSSASVKFARSTAGSFSISTQPSIGNEVVRGARPLIELKQLGTLLKNPGNPMLVESRRHYAKGRDKPRSKNTKVVIDENEMAEAIDVEDFKKQLELQITQMKDDFTKQLSIRGAAGALESLEIEFEGEVYPLQELAQVGRKNPQLAILNMSSLPDAIKPVMKAIEESGMNLSPQQEGTTIYVPLPKVTREHRENLAKNAKALFNKYKVAMQGVQNKFVKKCRAQAGLSEDLLFSVQQQIMQFTNNYIAEAEKLMLMKQKELLENK